MTQTPSNPIAIIGIGCRFPGGAHDHASYLRFLEASGDGVKDQPADRWSPSLFQDERGAAGRTEVRRAGFLEQDIFTFDANFFGISPREAATLDPQQRLLLEVCWEALEDAGLPASALAGSPTGVFVGGFTLDAMLSRFSAANQDAIDNHTATSSSMTLLSNRLSYALDLRGPSMTIDTACSSSLVALHLACEALSRGECSVALAGGVNVMLLPYYQIVMSKGHFLAADGRSKTFEADADGYGRGEGAGLLVLKPLADALADGDTIHAVIRGTGVNQDGATDGIPMPNPDAQRALIEATCRRAGIAPESVGYVEAHGTGTRVGDVVETRAIGSTYGRERSSPLPIGSVKANIGHLEAAAGVAGLIKAVLSVRERRILPHRTIRRPNPEIPFAALGVRVPQTIEPWPVPGPARAAVNSFGYGGTNAHVIVEAPPERPPARPAARARELTLLPVSSRSTAGLAASAERLIPLCGDVAALAGALAHRRSQEPVRAALVSGSPAELAEGLRALAEGRHHPSLLGPSAALGGRVWVFTGMGPQWWGMGRELYNSEWIFADALREVDALFQERAGWSILEALLAAKGDSRMASNAVAQPANLLLQVGLVSLLRSWGLQPDAILGHSVGEVAAAWAAGCLSLPDAVTVAVHRSRLQQRAAGQGGMLAVGVGREELGALLRDGRVVLAADNAPDLVTLAGPEDALAALGASCEARGIFARPVRVEVPYHSPAMDPIREELLASLAHLAPRAPTIPLFSTLYGEEVRGAVHDAEYWWQNTRQPVRLRDATDAALDAGHRLFLEIGPHPVLGPSLLRTLQARGETGRTLHCLRRGDPEQRSLLSAAGACWTHGQRLDWGALAPEGARVDLPLTVWQRQHHWSETSSGRQLRLGRPEAHPLLARREPGPDAAWSTRLAGPRLGWIQEHVVQGSVVLPGAATVSACLAAAAELGHEPIVEDLRFEAALVLPDGAPVDLRLQASDAGRVEVHGRVGLEGAWTRQASGRLGRGARYRQPADLGAGALDLGLAGGVEVNVTSLYASLEGRGLAYGPRFRGVRRLWRRGPELLAELALPGGDTEGFGLHPALLDAAFQCMVALAEPAPGVTVLPVGLRRARLLAPVGPRVWVHGRLLEAGSGAWEGDLLICDEAGRALAEVKGLRCEAALQQAPGRGWLHAERWVPVTLEAGAGSDGAEVFGAGPFASRLRQIFGAGQGARSTALICLEPEGSDPMGLRACEALRVGLERAASIGSKRTLILTFRGTAASPGESVDPAAAAIHGMARVAMNEAPERGIRLLDLGDPALDPIVVAHAAEDLDEELAWRGASGFLARRVRRVEVEDLPAPRAPLSMKAGAAPMALELGVAGRLDTLRYRAVPRPAPGPGEVEIEVDAASVNFKDVMKAMGMLHEAALENAYLGRGLGLEAAGRVTRVGAEVAGLAAGDAVFTYKGGALRSHIVADARFVVRRPDNLDATAGASLFVFLTAWYALVHAGRGLEGETVLIHSAAGGVGLAGVQIARMLGLRVLATAGTAEKRAFLLGLGVEHVFDSRTLDFVDEVRAATGGRGVDLVLNALAGPALVESLGLVAPGGRFLELGKQDLGADRAIGLRPFNRSISFIAIDLDRLATERPAWFAPVAREVMAAFGDGRLRPLPTEVFPADRVEAAFRALASGERIGKVVLAMRAGRVALEPARARPIAGGRSWLITGGLGGFGLRVAAWLADQGVRELVLAGRRGVVDPSDAPLLEAIRARGVAARAISLDVTDPVAVQAAVDAIPSLGGVVHAAMELADRPLATLDAQVIERAMGAKAMGAWNLHCATLDRDLDHFVLIGSISAVVGNPGQAAYAAANAALDGLARLRAAACLPATCVSLGALGEAGVVARDASTKAHLQGLGLNPMAPQTVLDRLGAALQTGCPNLTLVDIDWARWARVVPGVGWRRLEGLTAGAGGAGAETGVAALAPAERRAALETIVREAAASVFRMDPGALDRERSLRDQGLDSILAVELSVLLRARLGVALSAMDLLAGRGIGALVDDLLRRIGGGAEPTKAAKTAPAEPSAEDLLALICVTRPYLALEELGFAGDAVIATVVPDVLPGQGTAPVAAGELGRHLAILGSLACARAWPKAGRHAWPVASSTLELEPGAPAPAGARFTLDARCVRVDLSRGSAEAEGAMRTMDGRLVGRLRVGYHVLPFDGFLELFSGHRALTAEARYQGPNAERSPYACAPEKTPGTWDGQRFTRLLPPVSVEACAGHFAGLPALPVSILGRQVQAAVLDGVQAAGLDATTARVSRAELVTERFAWAGEQVELRAGPRDGDPRGPWCCEVRVPAQDAVVARFVLQLEHARPAQADLLQQRGSLRPVGVAATVSA